uniref:Uncharacterized protein n=1 Tax=Oryza glumipatula TaxID=40148 RepID=A0A0E0BIP1_9ORYZ
MVPTLLLLSHGLHDDLWPALQVGSDLREGGTNARVTSDGSAKRGGAGEQEEGDYAKEEMD